MIAFLECIDAPGRKSPAFLAERVYFLDLPAIKISVFSGSSRSGKKILKNLERVRAFLLSARVRNIIFSDLFPYSDFFLDKGFLNVSDSDLRHIAVSKLADAFSSRDGKAAIIAGELDKNCRDILFSLCGKNRFVIADIGRGALAEIDKLRRETGASVITQSSDKQLLEADLAVIMSRPRYRTVFSDSCFVFAADEAFLEFVFCKKAVSAVSFGLTPVNENKIISGFSRQQQIASAVSCFKLRPEDITLGELKFFEHVI